MFSTKVSRLAKPLLQRNLCAGNNLWGLSVDSPGLRTFVNDMKTSSGRYVILDSHLRRHRQYSTSTVIRKSLSRNIEEKYPEITEFDKDEVVNFLEMISTQGLQIEAGVEIILKYPKVLTLPEETITSMIGTLRVVGYKEEHRNKLLRKFPRVFELNKAEVADRIGFLKTYFESSAESLKVILNSAEALVDKEIILKRKLNYLIIGMSHSTAAIKNCSVLSHSLDFMKMRHEFLIRAGLFKPIPYRKLIKVREKEKGSKTARPKYFKPEFVVCTGDNEFLKRCTHNIFTVNDLAAFEQVYFSSKAFRNSEDDAYSFEHAGGEGDESDSDYEEDHESDDEDSVVINSRAFCTKAEGENFYF